MLVAPWNNSFIFSYQKGKDCFTNSNSCNSDTFSLFSACWQSAVFSALADLIYTIDNGLDSHPGIYLPSDYEFYFLSVGICQRRKRSKRRQQKTNLFETVK